MFSNNKFYFRHLEGSMGLANSMGKSPQHSSIPVVLFIELLYVILCVCGEKKPVLEETKMETEHARRALDHPCSNEIPKLNQGWILFYVFPSGGVVVSSSDILVHLKI